MPLFHSQEGTFEDRDAKIVIKAEAKKNGEGARGVLSERP